MKKHLIALISFLLVIVLVLWGLTELVLLQPDFHQSEERFDTYRSFKADTVDAVFVGTSGIDRYYIPALGFEEYGITAYPLSSDAQPTWLTINVLEEMEKHQTPQLLILDIRCFTTMYSKKIGSLEAASRYLTDNGSLTGANRVDAINNSLDALRVLGPEEEFDKLTFYFPLIKHHSAWSSIDRFVEEKAYSKLGFYMSPTRTIVTTDEFEDYTGKIEDKGELHPMVEENLGKILDYLDTKDYKVLFLDTPQGRSEEEVMRVNTVCDIVSQRGHDYLVCPIDETYSMTEDFYNSGHVNFYGAQKFTDYFAQYLVENYDLKDHRGDDKYSQWDGHYSEIEELVAQWENEAKE